MGTGVVAGDDAVAELFQVAQRRSFGPTAEPAPPPRLPRDRIHTHLKEGHPRRLLGSRRLLPFRLPGRRAGGRGLGRNALAFAKPHRLANPVAEVVELGPA